jgi:integrase
MWTVFLTAMVTVPRWTPQSGTSATEPGPLACRSGGDSDGHVPRDWFRVQVWKPACATAKLGIKVTVRDLRHAHASWLLAGGADLQVVKERLGHARISTTEKYLHTLPDADESAVDAFIAIRRRRSVASA